MRLASSLATTSIPKQSVKDYVYDPWFAAFPDSQITIEDLIAEGDKVMGRGTLRIMTAPRSGRKTTCSLYSPISLTATA
jgi:predicted ester cyclase